MSEVGWVPCMWMVWRPSCRILVSVPTAPPPVHLANHRFALPTPTPTESRHAASPEMQLRAAEQAWLASGERQSPFGGSGSLGASGGGTPEQQLRAAAAAYRSTGQIAASDGGGSAAELSGADALRLAVGGVLLEHIQADLAAASNGDSASRRDLAAISSTSPELDSIREGAQALLRYFVSKGKPAPVLLSCCCSSVQSGRGGLAPVLAPTASCLPPARHCRCRLCHSCELRPARTVTGRIRGECFY